MFVKLSYFCQLFSSHEHFFGKTPSTRDHEARPDAIVEVSARSVVPVQATLKDPATCLGLRENSCTAVSSIDDNRTCAWLCLRHRCSTPDPRSSRLLYFHLFAYFVPVHPPCFLFWPINTINMNIYTYEVWYNIIIHESRSMCFTLGRPRRLGALLCVACVQTSTFHSCSHYLGHF